MSAEPSQNMKTLRAAHSDPAVEDVLKRVITVSEANKREIGLVDNDLALANSKLDELNKKVDALSVRHTVGFILLGLLVAFVIVLQFATLTKRADVHVIPVSAEHK